MASIQRVTLKIQKVPNSPKLFIQVGYSVTGSTLDTVQLQPYREVCQLIGDDTPGDGTDDLISKIFDTTTVFFPGLPKQTRVLGLELPASQFDEDSGGIIPKEDQIRARVTLTPIPKPASRESNQIVLNALVATEG